MGYIIRTPEYIHFRTLGATLERCVLDSNKYNHSDLLEILGKIEAEKIINDETIDYVMNEGKTKVTVSRNVSHEGKINFKILNDHCFTPAKLRLLVWSFYFLDAIKFWEKKTRENTKSNFYDGEYGRDKWGVYLDKKLAKVYRNFW